MAYSFLDVSVSIIGLGGSFNLGSGSGAAEEGISVEMAEDKNSMLTGADGTVMHTLNAGNAGTVTVRLLKTSPTNALLSAMYNAQRINSAAWGKNVITVRNTSTGDVSICVDCAFKRWPSNTYAKAPNVMEWTFDAGRIDGFLGAEG